jgi:hypothetical protein
MIRRLPDVLVTVHTRTCNRHGGIDTPAGQAMFPSIKVAKDIHGNDRTVHWAFSRRERRGPMHLRFPQGRVEFLDLWGYMAQVRNLLSVCTQTTKKGPGQ